MVMMMRIRMRIKWFVAWVKFKRHDPGVTLKTWDIEKHRGSLYLIWWTWRLRILLVCPDHCCKCLISFFWCYVFWSNSRIINWRIPGSENGGTVPNKTMFCGDIPLHIPIEIIVDILAHNGPHSPVLWSVHHVQIQHLSPKFCPENTSHD